MPQTLSLPEMVGGAVALLSTYNYFARSSLSRGVHCLPFCQTILPDEGSVQGIGYDFIRWPVCRD
jgi:hypothetical protein